MKDIIRVTVVGGSACSSVGLRDDQKSWPEYLFENCPNYEIRCISIKGMTLVKSVEILFGINPCDLLILHFGTSVGWPIILVKLQDRFGIKFSREIGFHQPLKSGKNTSRFFKLRKYLKLKIKNFIKYIFLILGLYKPKTSIHEIRDQIQVVASLAAAKGKRVIWIQHRALQDSHTFAERFFFKRYYSKIFESLEALQTSNIHTLPIPDSFMIRENFLNDYIHLSERGHFNLSYLIYSEISSD